MAEGLASAAPLVQLRGLAKSYDGVRALRQVDLDICAGEVHALLGENGAGKSTLIKILAGVVARDAGSIEWCGKEVEITSRRDAIALGIGVIFQHPEIVDHLSVGDNVTLGRERARLGFVDAADTERRTAHLLDRLGAGFGADRLAGTLRAGERQLVEIARALADDVRLLVMDEPTASLGHAEVDRLFTVVRQLRESGIAVLYISHRIEEILTITDRITVLRDGANAGSLLTEGATRDQIVKMMVGRLATTEVSPPRQSRPATALQVQSLTAPGVHDISFELCEGEVLGLYGLMGSGRTELLRALFGASRPVHGSIEVGGHAVALGSTVAAVDAGIGFVPEDRAAQGTMARLSVTDNLTMARAGVVDPRGWVRPRAERRAARRIVADLGIKTASVDAPVGTLSGGNQQKVVIGKWLLGETAVLLLDEPTAGVDVGAKAEIYRIIGELVRSGTAVILATSELPELIAMADRVLVLRDGRVAGVLDAERIDEASIVTLAFGEDMGGVEWSEASA